MLNYAVLLRFKKSVPLKPQACYMNYKLLLLAILLPAVFASGATPPGRVQELFNGTDLTGWKHVGPGSMSIENGLLRGHGGMGLLYWAGGPFGNCTFHIVYRMRDENDNSGVFIRIP